MKFCEDILDTPSAARLHKVLAEDKTKTTVSLKKSDGIFTENEEQKAQVLLEPNFFGCALNEIHMEESIYTRPRHEN